MLFSAAETRRLPENGFSGSLLIVAIAKAIISSTKRRAANSMNHLAKRAYAIGNEVLRLYDINGWPAAYLLLAVDTVCHTLFYALAKFCFNVCPNAR